MLCSVSLIQGARLGHGRCTTSCEGKTIFSFLLEKILETLFVTFSQKYVKYFFGQFPFLRNFNPTLDESPHCLGLAVNGNHKLVSACNKGSTDPFVENDQQM